jgi:hypothetical protein
MEADPAAAAVAAAAGEGPDDVAWFHRPARAGREDESGADAECLGSSDPPANSPHAAPMLLGHDELD